MIEASCHCGAVRMHVGERPQRLTACNCSICHRIGALWAYYRQDQVTFAAGAGTTVPCVQGDRTLEMHHCPTCGCVTHWESVKKGDAERMAVNARLISPDGRADSPLRWRIDVDLSGLARHPMTALACLPIAGQTASNSASVALSMSEMLPKDEFGRLEWCGDLNNMGGAVPRESRSKGPRRRANGIS